VLPSGSSPEVVLLHALPHALLQALQLVLRDELRLRCGPDVRSRPELWLRRRSELLRAPLLP
jgi:hypothetical protein